MIFCRPAQYLRPVPGGGAPALQLAKRIFRLMEADDPKVMYEASYAWSDLGKVEIVPVMDSDDLLKMLSSKK